MIVIPNQKPNQNQKESEDIDITPVMAEDSGRLTSARFLSLHNGEVTELYKSSDYSTKEIKNKASYRVIMQHIEAVVYKYLCDSSYRLIETKHKAPDGSKIKVNSKELF